MASGTDRHMIDPEGFAIRPFGRGDLPAALALQAAVYPAHLKEAEQAFASHLGPLPSYCLVATANGTLAGYLLAHGWKRHSPPPLGMVVSAETPCEVLYIHDLAISPAARGSGIGRAMAHRAFTLAARDGIANAELVAVEGADRFWRALGFTAADPPQDIAARVRGYGPDAQWMTRAI